ESEVPKKRKLQEQIDAHVAKEMEEEFARENQRVSEQLERDYEIARLHAKEELKMMIEGLDRSNEMIAKHLQEYEQTEANLSVGEKIELIRELVKYQDHHTKSLNYQAQKSKPLSKKEQREFYMAVLKSHAGWKTKHFRGIKLEQIKEKFIHVWKQLEDFVPMSSKEEEFKGMMQLVPLEEVYVEALQVKHPIIDWEIHSEGKREYWKIIRLGGHIAVYQFFVDMLKQFDREDLHQLWTLVKETLSIKQATKDKEKELWVELKRLFEPDFEDQLWTHNQAFMHDPLDWKLYDTCGVHHVFTKDQDIFMLVERDYPLRKGLVTVMIILDEELIEPSSPVAKTEGGERAETKAVDSSQRNMKSDIRILKMLEDVARGHGSDGGDDDRPFSHQVPTGCGGCLGKGTQKPNLGGRKAGRLHSRQETQNLGLTKITDLHGHVPILFEWNDRETLMPFGDHAVH
nr:hypothetical protein [Tanacetum cinerariifolium]